MSLLGLNNTRTTFQRFSDARLFTGWVREYHGTVLRVGAELRVEVRRGDWFRFTLYGHERDVHVNGCLSSWDLCDVLCDGDVAFLPGEKEYVFDISGEAYTTPSSGAARWATDPVGSVVRCAGTQIAQEGILMDAGIAGIAVQCPEGFIKGERVEVLLQTAFGGIELTGEVRYCRNLGGDPAVSRVGIAIDPPGRLDLNRFLQLLERLGEAA
jgi:hypothetical protein